MLNDQLHSQRLNRYLCKMHIIFVSNSGDDFCFLSLLLLLQLNEERITITETVLYNGLTI